MRTIARLIAALLNQLYIFVGAHGYPVRSLT